MRSTSTFGSALIAASKIVEKRFFFGGNVTTVSTFGGDRDRDRLMNTFSSFTGTTTGLAIGCCC